MPNFGVYNHDFATCAAVSLWQPMRFSDRIVKMQVAGVAFLLGGVAMFVYQVWAWWRHSQQVRAYPLLDLHCRSG